MCLYSHDLDRVKNQKALRSCVSFDGIVLRIEVRRLGQLYPLPSSPSCVWYLLAPLEDRRPFFEKRSCTFAHVFRFKQRRKDFGLEFETFFKWKIETAGDGFQASSNRERRELGDFVHQRCGL